jgi:uncharacterized membrane protein YhaH (DUF805 family)
MRQRSAMTREVAIYAPWEMASWIDRFLTPHTPWPARLSRRGYWWVVSGFVAAFAVGVVIVGLAFDETVATSVVMGVFAAVLLLGGAVLLWGELRTFWPERR